MPWQWRDLAEAVDGSSVPSHGEKPARERPRSAAKAIRSLAVLYEVTSTFIVKKPKIEYNLLYRSATERNSDVTIYENLTVCEQLVRPPSLGYGVGARS
jgi:hypothetical protein